MFTNTLALLLLPALAAAQYGGAPVVASSGSGSASSTSTGLAVAPTAPPDTSSQINVNVAFGGQLVFNPPNISAPVGTLVTFYFPNLGLNHSVTQSSFAHPCTYLAANTTTNASAGFDSGLQSAVTFTIEIIDLTPIWFYCKQVMHCGMGMVGSINAANTTNTYAEYLAAAKAIGSNEVLTPDNGPVISGVHATATGSPVPDLTATSSTTSTASGALKVTTSFGFAFFAAVLATAIAMA